LLDVLEETPGDMIYGLKEANRLEERVSTFSFNLKGFSLQQVA
jgi:selenocysteine lyase/cysteine desulfurase